MLSKNSIKQICLFAILTIGLFSCKKKENGPLVFKKMTLKEVLEKAKEEDKAILIQVYDSLSENPPSLDIQLKPNTKLYDYVQDNFICAAISWIKEERALRGNYNIHYLDEKFVLDKNGKLISLLWTNEIDSHIYDIGPVALGEQKHPVDLLLEQCIKNPNNYTNVYNLAQMEQNWFDKRSGQWMRFPYSFEPQQLLANDTAFDLFAKTGEDAEHPSCDFIAANAPAFIKKYGYEKVHDMVMKVWGRSTYASQDSGMPEEEKARLFTFLDKTLNASDAKSVKRQVR
jgi:hypothetical protein